MYDYSDSMTLPFCGLVRGKRQVKRIRR